MRHDDERHSLAVDLQLEALRKRGGVPGATNVCAFLERRDLGEIEGKPDVDGVTREIDSREVVDREVAERMRGCRG